MKVLIFAFCVISATAASRCNSGSDCQTGECCVTYSPYPFFSGSCKDLRKEGEACTPMLKKGQVGIPKKYLFQCPCNSGMQCVGDKEIEKFGQIIRINLKCVMPGEKVTTEGVGDGGEIGEPDAQ